VISRIVFVPDLLVFNPVQAPVANQVVEEMLPVVMDREVIPFFINVKEYVLYHILSDPLLSDKLHGIKCKRTGIFIEELFESPSVSRYCFLFQWMRKLAEIRTQVNDWLRRAKGFL